MESISKFIEKKLGLIVNAEKSKVCRPQKLKFLGYGYYVNSKGQYRPKLHLKSIERFKRKLKQLTKRSWSISLDNRIKQINYLIHGWVNYFRIADMKRNMQEVDQKLRARIRVVIWKQWKNSKKRIESLVKLGIPPEEAKGISVYWAFVRGKSCAEQRTAKETWSSVFARPLPKGTCCNMN